VIFLICHCLTASDDILILETSWPLYIPESLLGLSYEMEGERGAALIVDDHSESVYLVRILPRLSWHGEGGPSVLAPHAEEISTENAVKR
jgi:hypothetical protein